MAEVTLESLAAEVAYLKDALHELLRRVPGVVAVTVPAEQEPEVEYWPSAIAGQKVPKITGNLSLDFTAAMMGGRREPTPERDAALAEHAAAQAAVTFVGKWDADSLTDSDAGAIYAYTRTQPGTALWNRVYWQAALFSGPRAAIARLIGRGERAFNEAGGVAEAIVAGWADCELKRDVTAVTV